MEDTHKLLNTFRRGVLLATKVCESKRRPTPRSSSESWIGLRILWRVRAPVRIFGAFRLDVRTLTFCQTQIKPLKVIHF